MTNTHRLGLPLLAAGQAQKEIVHNEALLLLDLLSQPVALSADLVVPPSAPVSGQCWIIGAAASGEWAGKGGFLVGWTDYGWRYLRPGAGWRIWVADRECVMRFDGAGWANEALRNDGLYVAGNRVLGAQQAAIANPSGGATIDSVARATLVSLLTVMRNHGLIAT